jgi:NADH:ubiquinone oxidoreductase subunit 2 (subunit N)
VFAAVIERGPTYAWYAVVGAVNAAVGAYYYFRVLKTMVIDAEAVEKPPLRVAPADLGWVVVLALANLVPIFFWGQVEGWARQSLTLWAGR